MRSTVLFTPANIKQDTVFCFLCERAMCILTEGYRADGVTLFALGTTSVIICEVLRGRGVPFAGEFHTRTADRCGEMINTFLPIITPNVKPMRWKKPVWLNTNKDIV